MSTNGRSSAPIWTALGTDSMVVMTLLLAWITLPPCIDSSETAWRVPLRRESHFRGWRRQAPADRTRAGAQRTGCSGPYRAVLLPDLVQAALDLHDPDDASHDGDEDPEAGQRGHRRLLAFFDVQIPHLVRHKEHIDDTQEDGEQQAQSPSDSLPGVRLHLLERGVLPVEAVDPDRHQ